MPQYADVLRNNVLDAFSATYGAGAKLRIYTGALPADESAALGGATMLIEYTIAPAAAAAGSKNMIGGTLSGSAVGAGIASFYRIYNGAGSTCFEQGTVGMQDDGTAHDLELDNTNIKVGQTVNVTNFIKNLPG